MTITNDQRTISDLFGLAMQMERTPENLRRLITPLLVDHDFPVEVRQSLRDMLAVAAHVERIRGIMAVVCEKALADKEEAA